MTTETHVLHVYKTYVTDTLGGLEEAIRQICRATRVFGFSNEVYTLTPQPHPSPVELEETKVWRYKRLLQIRSCDIPGATGLSRFQSHVEECDVLHYHYPWPFGDLLHLASRLRKPSVVTYHSDIVRQKILSLAYAPIMRRFLDSVDVIVATSPNYLRTSPILKQYKQKVCVIPLGLDPSSVSEPDPDLLRAWENRIGHGFFLFIGAFRYYKGLQYLIEAVRGTALRIILVGTGPEESRLRKIARGMGNIGFAGQVSDPDKFALLKLARCVVLPSHLRSEAFGTVLLEGALFGKPLISTEIGTGTSFVNIAGETGLVVPPADPQALRRAMEMIADDDNLTTRMGEASKTRFNSMFTSTLMGELYADLYRSVLRGFQ